jgi:hypothetical protein
MLDAKAAFRRDAASHDTWQFRGKGNMHVLVTGDAGIVGGHTVVNLAARGYGKTGSGSSGRYLTHPAAAHV